MKFAFIRDHLAAEYPVRLCCRVLCVSPSGYYHARVPRLLPRRLRRAQLATQVRIVHEQSLLAYGSPRIARELRRAGTPICRNTAARLMREQGLRSRRARRFRPRTTDSSRTRRPAPNLRRQASPPVRPAAVWVADITYLRVARGFVYLAAVMDLYSRRIVGWAVDDSLHTSLAQRAVQAAIRSQRPAPGLIHHSDRGVQYASVGYRALLARHGIVPSMSRKGDCYDNAAMESFFASLKTEFVGEQVFDDLIHAHDQSFRYIEGFYNHRRLHSSIDYRTPDQVHFATL